MQCYKIFTRAYGLIAKSSERGTLECITYFDSTQFAVYNGVTHDPQNPSVIRLAVEMIHLGHDFHVSSSSGYK